MIRLRTIEICREQGITQKQLAAKIGITEVGLSKATNGNTSMQTLEKIANALGVEVYELFAPKQEHQNSDKLICPNCGAKLRIVKE